MNFRNVSVNQADFGSLSWFQGTRGARLVDQIYSRFIEWAIIQEEDIPMKMMKIWWTLSRIFETICWSFDKIWGGEKECI